MKTKGVAISQIILLVLGIIVLSVVAFLLYSNFTTTTGQIDVQKCRAVATNACTSCSIANGGTPQNCAASTYLFASDKACGLAIASTTAGQFVGSRASPNDPVTLGGDIDCKQYVGGSGLTGGSNNQQPNDITGQTCSSEGSLSSTGCTGTNNHMCISGTWTECR